MDKNHKIKKRTLQDGHCVLILIIVTAVLFRKALLGGPVILSHPIFLDLTHHIYAWRLYGFGLLKSGTIPLGFPGDESFPHDFVHQNLYGFGKMKK